MLIKNYFKKGLILFAIYTLIAVLVLMSANRVERLEEKNYSTVNSGIEIKFGK